MDKIYVKKHNGNKELLDIEKNTKSLEWATTGLKNVSISEIQMRSKLQFYNGMYTTYIHDVMVKTSKDMINIRNPEYDIVFRNLQLQKAYKEAYGSITPPSIREQLLKQEFNLGYNTKKILDFYTDEEIDDFNSYIRHDRDFILTGVGVEQMLDKYILKDLKTGRIGESPNMMFMLIALDAFRGLYSRLDHTNKLNRDKLITYVKKLYDLLSYSKISLPTPMMRALRTVLSDYASCITITIGDKIVSWEAGFAAILLHTVASAGIGVDISLIASIGDAVKQGKISHPGKIPVMRNIDSTIQVASQNGRRGQAVTYVNFFDPEIEVILAIKSPRTEVQKRINDLKHAIKFNKLAYNRAKNNQPISLFSTRKHPKLSEYFNSNNYDAFEKLYIELEEAGLYESQINGGELLEIFTTERFENGIYYIFNIDEANANSSFTEPIYQSNICMEFISPTRPIDTNKPDSPDIGVCILTNINQAKVDVDELDDVTDVIVTMLNNIKGRQQHPTGQAQAYVKQYGTLGIGFSNHAYWLAKQDYKYGSEEGLRAHNRWMEYFQYNLIRASTNNAKLFGSAPKFDATTYARGIMPLDRYKKTVDELVEPSCNELDWNTLKEDVLKYGMANCGLSMIPPSETSSVTGAQTSGMEPIRDLLTIKGTKNVQLKQLAPEALKLADKYDFAFDRRITQDYLKNVAVTQKWICMGISTNTYYNPELYEDELVPMDELIEDIYFAKYYGIKTIYYNNVKTKDEDAIQDSLCSGDGCSV